MKYLNLACGSIVMDSNEWVNCDFSPLNRQIKQANLLEELPFQSDSFDLIYSSHFIEHLSLDNLKNLLTECNRILKKNGKIRLVLPDFENIVKEYIFNLNNERILLSQFNIVELIDQCTRKFSGGQLSLWRSKASGNLELSEYIKKRTGLSPHRQSDQVGKFTLNRIKRATPKKLYNKIQFVIIFKLMQLFPKWVKSNHFSFVKTGEQHLWMHDFNSIANFLHESGFGLVKKMNAYTSNIPNFPLYPLDLTEEKMANKGESSMYIEAQKL